MPSLYWNITKKIKDLQFHHCEVCRPVNRERDVYLTNELWPSADLLVLWFWFVKKKPKKQKTKPTPFWYHNFFYFAIAEKTCTFI